MTDNTVPSIVPDNAEKEETAAIMVAVSAYLRNERAVLSDPSEKSWTGKRWAFTGRLKEQRLKGGRVPLSAPVDPWTAAGRGNRY